MSKTDMIIAIATLVALLSVAAVAIGLVALDNETVGESIVSEPQQIEVSVGEPKYIHGYGDRIFHQWPSAFMVDSVTINDVHKGSQPSLEISIQVPHSEMEFRYLEVEYSSPDASFVLVMWGNGFRVENDETSGCGRFTLLKGDLSAQSTQNFDLNFCLDSDDIDITFKIGRSDGKVIEEHVYPCSYHLNRSASS